MANFLLELEKDYSKPLLSFEATTQRIGYKSYVNMEILESANVVAATAPSNEDLEAWLNARIEALKACQKDNQTK